MIDFGTVRPGTTLYIPFHTFDSNDPSASVTITGLATTDIEVYKDGSVTQRASDAGYSLLDTDGIDFDSTTGIHGISIDLSDNTTGGFYAAGSQYWVVIASITVDAATVNFIAATFRIGYPDAFHNTTIATLSTQTSFTLTAGPAEDDALNGCMCIVHDVESAVQLGWGRVTDYTGSTKTVTLSAGVTFTAAATDNISFYQPALQPTVAGRTLDVTATGAAGIDWANVESPSTSVDLSATSINLCDTVSTLTGHTVQTGDSFARLGAPAGASVSADVAAVKAETALIVADTNELQTDNVPGLIAALNDVAATDIVSGGAITTSAGAVSSVTLVATTTNVTNQVSADATAISGSATTADNMQLLFDGLEGFASAYAGPRGPGVYLNDALSNTNAVGGVDGTISNPVSDLATAKSLADMMSFDRIYLVNDTAITLAATMVDYEFVGIGGHDATKRNSVALASQDVSNSAFYNVEVTGVQGGTSRALYEDCFFGTATIYALARRCGFTDSVTGVTMSNNDDNVLDQCFSAVPGNSAPIIIGSGANLDLSIRHYSGGVELKGLNATATVSIETDGQVIFNADCSTSAAVTIRGLATVTDNTGGMGSVTDDARIDVAQVNAQVLDVLNVDTFAESAGVPSATATLVDKIGWLCTLARNKLTQTSTTQTLRNDADSGDVATATVSDDGSTATRGEWT